MKKSFKTIVRAISPFTSAKSKAVDSAASDDAERWKKFTWNLTTVDMVMLLTSFYKEHNPDRVDNIHEILHHYEGEEVLMLQELCDRYSLSQDDMQRYVDASQLGRKDRFGSWAKKKSENVIGFDEGEGKTSASAPEANARKRNLDFNTFRWDLTNVDLGKALKLLYKKHNPQKMPNIASLENKTLVEKIMLLQQLCKRHLLTQQDMQDFLNQAIKQSDEAISDGTPSGEAGMGPSMHTMRYHSIISASTGFFPPANMPPTPPSPSQRLQQQRLSTSISAEQKAESMIFGSSDGGGPVRRNSGRQGAVDESSSPTGAGSLSFWSNNNLAYRNSISNAQSPPPPPPPPPMPTQQQRRPTGTGSSNNSLNEPTNPKSTSAAMSSKLRSPSPSPSIAGSVHSSLTGDSDQQSRHGGRSAPVSRGESATRLGNNRGIAAVSGSETGSEIDEDDVRSKATGGTVRSVATSNTILDQYKKSNADLELQVKEAAAKMEEITKELSEGKLQISGLQRENRSLLKAMQDLKARQAAEPVVMKSIGAERVSKTTEEDVVNPSELLLEVAKLNTALQQQEEREAALKRQYNQLKATVEDMQRRTKEAETAQLAAMADRRDVLRLVDVMSASPAGITAVLDAYLKKLGEATGSIPVKFGIGADGRQLPISERVSIALQLKREQENAAKEAARQEAVENETASDLPSSETAADTGNTTPQFSNSSAERSSVTNGRKNTSTQRRRNDPTKSGDGTKATTVGEPTTSDPAAAAGDIANDWIECMDPRSKRKYYYSASSKKSTWVKPANFVSKSNSPSRSASPSTSTISSFGANGSKTSNSRFASPNTSVLAMRSGDNQRMTVDELSGPAGGRGIAESDEFPLSPAMQRIKSLVIGAPSTQRAPEKVVTASAPLSTPASNSLLADYGGLFSSTPASGTNSRSGSENFGVAMGLATGASRPNSAGSRTSGNRAPSPAPSVASLVSGSTLETRASSAGANRLQQVLQQQQRNNRSSSARGDLSAQNGTASSGTVAAEFWETAIDPKSNRKYWYNKKTKVSTWRQPAELII